MAAYPKITSNPPLRQLSVIPTEQEEVRGEKKPSQQGMFAHRLV
jgi:hypothetical protein